MLNWIKAIKTGLAVGALAIGMLAATADYSDARRGGGGHRPGGGGGGGGGFHKPMKPMKPIKPNRPGGGGGGIHHRPGNGGNYHRPGGGNCRHHCGGNHYGNGWDAPRYGAGLATGIALGGLVYSLPGNCVTKVYSGVTYRQCGSTWYQRQYRNSGVAYVAVRRPF